MDRNDELKSCPFCDGYSVLNTYLNGDDIRASFFIACQSCPTKTKDYFSADKAIVFWNTRPREQKLIDSSLDLIREYQSLKNKYEGTNNG